MKLMFKSRFCAKIHCKTFHEEFENVLKESTEKLTGEDFEAQHILDLIWEMFPRFTVKGSMWV